MIPRCRILVVLLLLSTITSCSSEGPAPGAVKVRATEPMGAPQLETQIQNIAALSRGRANHHGPDARLFSALLRLEEMLPRSAATRRAQERGKKAYLAMVSSRSLNLASRWPAMREAIERVMRQDKIYMRSLAAVDRRLATDAAAIKPVPGPVPVASTSSLPFNQMRPGDIMIWDDRSGPPLVRLGISMYACKCTHTAIYLGETGARGRGVQRWTFEAQSPALGVRTAVMDRKWARPGLHVALGHVKGIAPARAAQITAAAIETYGADGRTPYHIWPPWDKTYYQEGLYCSQLVWKVYQQSGVDLDSNDWHYLAWFAVHNWFNPYAAPIAYFAVFPDEIKASPHITWYYDQVNPQLRPTGRKQNL